MVDIIDRNKWPENEYKFLAPDGCSYDSPFDYVWCDIFKFCGCYSDSLFNLTFEILNKLYTTYLNKDSYYYEYKSVSDEYKDLQELILHTFDANKLTEHGSAVRGCWLDDKGVEICKLLWGENNE